MSALGGRTAAGTPHRADIQGLRALAVLLVVAFYAGLPVPGGFMGVDVFFAISGFVITTMLLSELESSRGIDFPRFYLRRARRLLPALALMLSFVFLGAVLTPAVTQTDDRADGNGRARFRRERIPPEPRHRLFRTSKTSSATPVAVRLRETGTILYRDADHLSVDGSLTLTDRFYRAIEALAR
jgi:hypothetical protein